VVEVDVTVSLTGTVTVPAREESSTEALYVAAAKPPGLTETVIEAGVVPLVGLTESHAAPDVEALKLVLLLLVTDRLWRGGNVPPC
jgi:hypothetical protein